MVQTSYSPSDVYFWRQQKWKRSDVKTITFRTFQDAEKDIPVTAWDVSAAGDRSVVAWMVSGNLHVAATEKIVLNSNVSGMFAGFTNLTEIDFGDGLDTSKVTNMRNMFYDCGSLTSLDLSGFDTSKVTNMQSMFSSCSSLSELDLSGFDTSKVTDMARMFSSCGSLSKLDLSGFDSSNVGNMEDIFYGCSSLKNLICSDRKILAKYSAPASSLSSNANVMAKMSSASGDSYFWGQTKYKRSDVKTITFRTFQNAEKNIPTTAWDVSAAGDRSILAWMVSGNLHVAAAGKIAPNPDASYMFAHFANLEEIDFGDCFDTSNVTNMSAMFNDCRNLTSLDLSSFDTSNATNMSDMFHDCRSLSSLNLSGFDTSGVMEMRSMFHGCSSLTSLNLDDFDTANVTDMSCMFHSCSGLTSLNLSSFDASNATDMHWMFLDCGITKLIYSDSKINDAYINR